MNKDLFFRKGKDNPMFITGLWKAPIHNVWRGMKQRCENPRQANYKYYGAKGIKVCERWRQSFTNFLADMGDKPFGNTLDRIDSKGDYEPSNCRWATYKQQARQNFKHGKYAK